MGFISSSKATKYKQEVKAQVEEDFKEGGQRNWLQVLCNGGMAFELSLLYLLDIGSSDLPGDFRHQYRASWLGVAVLGALACCNGDTWASELGIVLAKDDPFLITTFQKVPKGTNGGVSPVGLLTSLLGGLVIGFAYFVGVMMSAASMDLELAPNQMLIILVGGLGGLLGSVLDSLIGRVFNSLEKTRKPGRLLRLQGKVSSPSLARWCWTTTVSTWSPAFSQPCSCQRKLLLVGYKNDAIVLSLPVNLTL